MFNERNSSKWTYGCALQLAALCAVVAVVVLFLMMLGLA